MWHGGVCCCACASSKLAHEVLLNTGLVAERIKMQSKSRGFKPKEYSTMSAWPITPSHARNTSHWRVSCVKRIPVFSDDADPCCLQSTALQKKSCMQRLVWRNGLAWKFSFRVHQYEDDRSHPEQIDGLQAGRRTPRCSFKRLIQISISQLWFVKERSFGIGTTTYVWIITNFKVWSILQKSSVVYFIVCWWYFSRTMWQCRNSLSGSAQPVPPFTITGFVCMCISAAYFAGPTREARVQHYAVFHPLLHAGWMLGLECSINY